MITHFDPDPDNQLGKGILSSELEVELLARGAVFAVRLPPRKGKPFWSLVWSQRPIADAVTDGQIDDPRVRRYPIFASHLTS